MNGTEALLSNYPSYQQIVSFFFRLLFRGNALRSRDDRFEESRGSLDRSFVFDRVLDRFKRENESTEVSTIYMDDNLRTIRRIIVDLWITMAS